MVAPWREKLRQASFRGVSFGVIEASTAGGRRTVSHEYPGRDEPYVEDLGRKGKTYNIQAFVVGPDYMTQRDLLMNALEQKGPGKLVHPFLGELTLQVSDFTFDETRDDGGMAFFQITFLYTKNVSYPSTSANYASQVVTKAQNVDLAAQAAAYKQLVIAGENRGYTQPAATETINDTMSAVQSNMKSGVARLTDNLAQWAHDLTAFSADLADYLVSPALLFNQVQYLMGALIGSTSPLDAVSIYRRVFDSIGDVFSAKSYGTSSKAALLKSNDAAIRQAAQLSVISCAAQCAIEATYQTRREAEDTRNAIDAMIEAIIYSITDDSIYQAILDLKTEVARAIPPEGVSLKDEMQISVQFTIPSLALAYSVYGNVDNELDLVARNDVENPFCIRAGEVTVIK